MIETIEELETLTQQDISEREAEETPDESVESVTGTEAETENADVANDGEPVQSDTESGGEDRLDELCCRQSIDAEYLEFARLFPGVSIATLPDCVCESVRGGVPLAAAYALYEKKRSVEASLASEANTKNASMSFRLNENSAEKYFSPDEVKAMSREEVRTNYKRIIESMRHWR